MQVCGKLDQIDGINTEAAIFRSKCAWTEYGEKTAKCFFSLEKSNYAAKNMKLIITDCGKHITEQKSILSEQTKFYKNLYSRDPKVNFKLERDP